jgi:hypothetical protein
LLLLAEAAVVELVAAVAVLEVIVLLLPENYLVATRRLNQHYC